MMLGMAAGLIGSAVSGIGAMSAANGQAQSKEAEAAEQRRKGIQEEAAKQRTALDEEDKMKKVISDQRAGLAAGGGGGVTGSGLTTVVDTAKRGTLNRDQTLWEGAEARAGRYAQGQILDLEAKNLRKSGQMQMVSSVVGGVSGVLKGGTSSFGGGGGSSSGFYY